MELIKRFIKDERGFVNVRLITVLLVILVAFALCSKAFD